MNDVPVQDGMLWPTREEALQAPRGDIELAQCPACSHIWNRRFDIGRLRYDREYTFSLHHSSTYNLFIQNLAERLVGTHNIRDRRIVEIACGGGDFLRLLCRLGRNVGFGIDPSVDPGASIQDVTFINGLFSEEYSYLEPDFICCRHVLDQLDNPANFVRMIHRAIAQTNKVPVVYFEVPNGTRVFENSLVWNVIYEKSSWFSAPSISRLFERSGFQVLRVTPCYVDGQYLGLEASPLSTGGQSSGKHPDNPPTSRADPARFDAEYQTTVRMWKEKIGVMASASRRVLVWGSGSAAITFLASIQRHDTLKYVVDINPVRQGKFIPIGGQRVVAPDFLHEYTPDIVLISNRTYESEIVGQVRAMGFNCTFECI